MHITKLNLSTFRNFESVSLTVGDAPLVALVGKNGAGKTTVLEALSLLSPGAGMLGAKRDTQIQNGAPQWGLFAELEAANETHTVGMAHLKNKQRQIKINGVESTRQVDLATLGHVVWFSPKYDRLFLDAAKPRRDFLDRMTFALCPNHAEALNRYRHHMRSRLRLLKDGIKGDWLDLEEERIAKHGVTILQNREAYLTALAAHLPELALAVTGSAQNVLNAEAPAAQFQEHLALARGRDGQYGDMHFGPHRSDITGDLQLESMACPWHRFLLASISALFWRGFWRMRVC
jgi:DNA replication and repair protein RecF